MPPVVTRIRYLLSSGMTSFDVIVGILGTSLLFTASDRSSALVSTMNAVHQQDFDPTLEWQSGFLATAFRLVGLAMAVYAVLSIVNRYMAIVSYFEAARRLVQEIYVRVDDPRELIGAQRLVHDVLVMSPPRRALSRLFKAAEERFNIPANLL